MTTAFGEHLSAARAALLQDRVRLDADIISLQLIIDRMEGRPEHPTTLAR